VRNDYSKVILDITHGYRFIPYAVSLGILLLKNLKDFELEIYYGFLEFQNEDGTRPVLRLNHLEELVKLSQALGILENTWRLQTLLQAYFRTTKKHSRFTLE
jgi:CRISPR-associated DxTHG motif protein